MSIREQENMLFEQWRKEFYPDKTFVCDGIINETKYKASSPKVVFLLKETNQWDSDLRDFLHDTDRKPTWDTAARWIWGIHELWHGRDYSWGSIPKDCCKFRQEQLHKIAVVNVKKTSGEQTSGESVIAKHALQNSDYLAKQLALYAPDVVLCGGAGVIYPGDEKRLSRSMPSHKRDGNTLVIYCRHPMLIGYSHEKAYNEIMAEISAAKSSGK